MLYVTNPVDYALEKELDTSNTDSKVSLNLGLTFWFVFSTNQSQLYLEASGKDIMLTFNTICFEIYPLSYFLNAFFVGLFYNRVTGMYITCIQESCEVYFFIKPVSLSGTRLERSS